MSNLKKCTRCNSIKSLNEFSLSKSKKDGHSDQCKECVTNYQRSKKGLLAKIHSKQRGSAKKRGMSLPSYDLVNLRHWVYAQKEFHELYDNWVISGYDTKLRPSLDRIDDYKSYTLDNLQIMTWEENNKKGYADRKNGVNNKISIKVAQINPDTGKVIDTVHSLHEAARQTGISVSNINSVCKGRTKTAGGYKWKALTGRGY